jgi:hypothetical protein
MPEVAGGDAGVRVAVDEVCGGVAGIADAVEGDVSAPEIKIVDVGARPGPDGAAYEGESVTGA